jgi:hypothetical protein
MASLRAIHPSTDFAADSRKSNHHLLAVQCLVTAVVPKLGPNRGADTG